MNRIAELEKESQSGPQLFINFEGRIITFGFLSKLLKEIDHALEGIYPVVEILEEGYAENATTALLGRLALDHAFNCLQKITPYRDIKGQPFWRDTISKVATATAKGGGI